MNKKGFTLIELLAVILILGIIALIAIPAVTNIIDESKRGSFKTTVENLLRAVEQECQIQQLKEQAIIDKYTFENGKVKTFRAEKLENGTLNVKGDLPKSGTIKVNDSCSVSIDEENPLSDGTFIAKTDDKGKIEVSKNDETSAVYVCKRATTLHTEECAWTVEEVLKDYGYETEEEFEDNMGYPASEELEEYYCTASGYATSGSKGTTIITYGNLGKQGEDMVSGDAFDCDVNNDGIYDPETERFYYVSDYYNSSSKEEDKFEKDKAVLIYYNNTTYDSNGNLVPDNTSASKIAYYADGSENWHGPVTAVTKLPTREQWKNENLITGKRAIIGKDGETSTKGGTLPTTFDYSNYAARLLTTQELSKGCNNLVVGSFENGELDICNYLLENTKYSSSSIGTYGYWHETPNTSISSHAWGVDGSYRYVHYINASYVSTFGARPAITVLKSNISY